MNQTNANRRSDSGSDDSGHSSVEAVNKKRRRGVRNYDQYKANVIKKARVKGIEYVSPSGKNVAARIQGEACRCPMKCFTKLSEDEKLILSKILSDFESKDEQDILARSARKKAVFRRRKRLEGSVDKRKYSFIHYVQKGAGPRIKVCLKAFLSLHGITTKRVKRLKNLLINGAIPHDKRGKNIKSHAIPESENLRKHQHISSYPMKETHYGNKEYNYHDSRLNVKILYNMFKKKYPDSIVKYSYYLRFFNDNFSLHFGQPQVDTCQCEELCLKIKSPFLCENSKRAAEAEYAVHKRKARKFYDVLKDSEVEARDKNKKITAIAFDYIQNLQLPQIPVQEVFYLTQLSVSLFCIHDLGTGKAYFYIYHEGTAAKGSNEVCSLIKNYIDEYADPESRELRLFSDNCPGQNKNHTCVRMCMALVQSGRFDKVVQFFPIRGHSFLPCDRDFGVIKRRLKKFDRIYNMHEFTEIIIKSSNANNFIKEISTKEILNFKDWWPKYYEERYFRGNLEEECEKK